MGVEAGFTYIFPLRLCASALGFFYRDFYGTKQLKSSAKLTGPA